MGSTLIQIPQGVLRRVADVLGRETARVIVILSEALNKKLEDISGTAKQILVTLSDNGAVTLSLPQDVDTDSSPTFAGLTLSGLTASRLLAATAAKAIESVGSLAAWLTGGTGVTVADDGDGTATVSIGQSVDPTDSPTFAGLTLSGATASRLLATDGDKALVSVANLASWVQGTNYKVTVTDNGDGTVTLSLPDLIRLGDATNYVEIDPDGTLSLNGGTVVWDSIKFGSHVLAKGAANQPTLINFDATDILIYAFDGGGATNELHGSLTLNHTYKEGTDIYLHVHWYPTTAAAGNVKWQIEYFASTTGYVYATDTVSVVSAATGTAWEQIMETFLTPIPGTDFDIGTQINFRIFRDSSDADDTYTDDAALGAVGVYHQVNTMGSKQMGTK